MHVEELEVESFHTHGGARYPGTVQGHGNAFDRPAQAEGAEAAITAPSR